MADCILFQKESNFYTAFVLAIGWPTWESPHEVSLIYNIYDEYLFQNKSKNEYQNSIVDIKTRLQHSLLKIVHFTQPLPNF